MLLKTKKKIKKNENQLNDSNEKSDYVGETRTMLLKNKKKIKKTNKSTGNKVKESSEKNAYVGEKGFVNPFGYQETDAYLVLSPVRYMAIFDVLIQYGTNRNARIGWVLDLIPKEQIVSGNIKFVQRTKQMDKTTEAEVLGGKLKSNKATIGDLNTGNSKEDSKRESRVADMTISEKLAGMENYIVDGDMRLIITAKSPEKLEQVIEDINTAYKNQDLKGITFIRRTGKQLKDLENIFNEVSTDAFHNSDMSTIASSRIFLPSSGFSDPQGVFMGHDKRAMISNNPSFIDFQGVKNAVIFTGGRTPFVSFSADEVKKNQGGYLKNGGSAIGHIVSDSQYLAGNRTHHIVISDFNYHSPDSLVFDMSKESINYFEVFGTPETVQVDATSNFNKATAGMLMLTKLADEVYSEQELKGVLVDWFIHRANGNGLYSDDPENNPLMAQRILATNDHTNYPTPRDFLSELRVNISNRAKDGERARERATFLYDSLNTTFDTYPDIFNKHTTLPNVYTSDDRNIYYDISKTSEDKNVLGVIFLNVIAYVTNRALNGEQIVIHGLDNLTVSVDVLEPYADRMKRKNLGLITIFERSENEVNPSTFRKFTGNLVDQDLVVLGKVTSKEIPYINESWNRELPNVVKNELVSGNQGTFYFYRKRDRVGAIVKTHLVL